MFRDKDLGIASSSVKDEFGNVVTKSLQLPPEAMSLFESIRQAYEAKFGGPPPEEMTIEEAAEKAGVELPSEDEFTSATIEAMEAVGIAPELIYAFRRTGGLLVTEYNQHMIDDRDLEAWGRAIEEYRASHGQRGISGGEGAQGQST